VFQATSTYSLADEGDWHAEVQSVDGGPFSSAFLASRVHDLLEEWLSIFIVEVHNVAGNLNQERIKDALVPLGEDITHLLASHTEATLHNVVGLFLESATLDK
jgi:hypothetical protein